MAEFLRYRMRPQDDLAVRTDFTADLMNSAKGKIQGILDSSPEIQDLRSRAAVDIRLAGSLSSVEIDVSVVPTPGSTLTPEDAETERQRIGKMIGDQFGGMLSDILQEGIDTARRRM